MATQGHSPAGARNLGTGGPTGGTLGGLGAARGRPLVAMPAGDALYLWALVILEALAIGWLRASFKRYHGG